MTPDGATQYRSIIARSLSRIKEFAPANIAKVPHRLGLKSGRPRLDSPRLYVGKPASTASLGMLRIRGFVFRLYALHILQEVWM